MTDTNRMVKTTLAETRVSLEQLAEEYGVTKQRMSFKLKKELPEDEQRDYCKVIIDIARRRIRNAEQAIES